MKVWLEVGIYGYKLYMVTVSLLPEYIIAKDMMSEWALPLSKSLGKG